MAYYVKKPVKVQAWQFTKDNIKKGIPDFIAKNNTIRLYTDGIYSGTINTDSGIHRVDIGDYIIEGVHGELYPCKKDIFNETYEEVE